MPVASNPAAGLTLHRLNSKTNQPSNGQGDYYYLRRMDPADKDVAGNLLNRDRTFGMVYKVRPMAGAVVGSAAADCAAICSIQSSLPLPASHLSLTTINLPPQDFITGPSNAATYGHFGVDQITGTGYALATDAWADAPEEPVEGHCIDSWTMLPVTVPIAGLTPYPADVRGQPEWAAQVIITPVAMLTLGNTTAGSVAQKYDAAYAALGVPAAGGLYGGGMVNSDPMVMLQSSDAAQVGAAVKTLAASAKVLDTLSVARALYECRERDVARLSNELFHQWTKALITPAVLQSAAAMTAALKDLCLTTCAGDAATALVAIHKQLDELTVGFVLCSQGQGQAGRGGGPSSPWFVSMISAPLAPSIPPPNGLTPPSTPPNPARPNTPASPTATPSPQPSTRTSSASPSSPRSASRSSSTASSSAAACPQAAAPAGAAAAAARSTHTPPACRQWSAARWSTRPPSLAPSPTTASSPAPCPPPASPAACSTTAASRSARWVGVLIAQVGAWPGGSLPAVCHQHSL
jgi:hypothetical protein